MIDINSITEEDWKAYIDIKGIKFNRNCPPSNRTLEFFKGCLIKVLSVKKNNKTLEFQPFFCEFEELPLMIGDYEEYPYKYRGLYAKWRLFIGK